MNVGFGSFASDIDVAGLRDDHHHPRPKSSLTVSPLSKNEDEISLPAKNTCALLKKIFLSICLYLAFVGTGFSGGIIGPTLVHLEYLFNTDTSGISKTFIGLNFGYLVGTFICATLFDKLNQEMQFAFWGMVLGVCCMVVPWLPGLYYYYAVVALQYLAQGVVYSGGQSYVIKLWHNYGEKGPALLGIYMCWSLGAFLGPFLAMPFLEELDSFHVNTTHLNPFTESINKSVFEGNTGNKVTGSIPLTGVHKVKYIYAIVGLIHIFAALLFLVGFVLMGPSCLFTSNKQDENLKLSTEPEKNERGNKFINTTKIKIYKGTIIFLVWLFAVMYFWHEYTIGCFISAFCLKGLHWPVEQSALITSIFFGFLGIGRIFGIGVAKILTPSKMLIINICLTTVGLSLLLFSHYSSITVWIAVSLAGYGMSTTSPSYVLWTSNYMTISGPIGAMFMAGSATGSMTSGGLVGYLFQNYSYMWVVYVSLGSSVVNIGIYFALTLVGKCLNQLEKEQEPDTAIYNQDLVNPLFKQIEKC